MGISDPPAFSPDGLLDALLRLELSRAASGQRVPPQATQHHQHFHPPQLGECESGRYRQFGEKECGSPDARRPWTLNGSDGRYQD